MRIKLLLSGIKDFDLLALSQNSRYKIGKEIKQALRMYIRGDMQSLTLPDRRSAPQEVTIEQRRISITLNDQADKDVIEWLNQIQPGCKSTAIKSVYRNMLEAPYLIGMEKAGSNPAQDRKRTKRHPVTTELAPNTPHVQKKASTTAEPGKQDDSEFDLFSDAFVDNR